MERNGGVEGEDGNLQVEETRFTDVCGDEFRGELDGVEEHRQVACGSSSKATLLSQNVSM